MVNQVVAVSGLHAGHVIQQSAGRQATVVVFPKVLLYVELLRDLQLKNVASADQRVKGASY